VTEENLEQQAILAVGWLRKAGRLAAPDASPDKSDLPPDAALSPREYALAQAVLARDAVEQLARKATEMRDRAEEQIKTALRRRENLAARTTGVKTAAAINAQARLISEQIEMRRREIARCDRLLRVLRGQEELPLPTLPLFNYAGALERLEHADAAPDTPPDSGATPPSPLHVRLCRAFMNRTDQSDRIALAIALLLCATVAAAGLYYVYNWGSIELEITPMDHGRIRVVCVNGTGDSILLNVPYDGGTLPLEQVVHYGILLEALDANGRATRPAAPETLWEYKDNPAHLYGPIVVGPFYAAELFLDFSSHPPDASATALRLTLFRAPLRKCKTYTVPLAD